MTDNNTPHEPGCIVLGIDHEAGCIIFVCTCKYRGKKKKEKK